MASNIVDRQFAAPNENKHSLIALSDFAEILGYLANKTEPQSDSLKSWIQKVNNCLKSCFHQILLDQIQMKSSACQICPILKALVHHYANCHKKQFACEMCLQFYRLLQGHVNLCEMLPEQKKFSSSDICYVLIETMDMEMFNINSYKFWCRSKKYISEIDADPSIANCSELLIHANQEEHNFISTSSEFSVRTQSSANSENLTNTVKQNDSQTSDASLLFGSPINNATVLSENWEVFDPDLQNIPFHAESQPGTSPNTGQNTDSSQMVVGAHPKLKRKVSRKYSSDSNKLCGVPELVEVEDFNSSHSAKSNQSNISAKSGGKTTEELLNELPASYALREYSQDPYDTQKTYGASRITSLPMDPNYGHGVQQFSSLEMRPVGQPGIGEVVYGTREQLRLVAHYWSKLKTTVKATTTLPRQKREEGVIISKYKKDLRILRTLYQKHCQWERISHLGNGAAGKCHLAMDLTTQFKFCVKRLIIHKYEEQELKVWCDLEHDNIVHLFGALRHGEKIYILAEFIDGGNLSACINEQKIMNRRLSHVMALTYLQQLLQVLVYLKSKGIIHEDIKSDNILLRRGTTSIAVCDFGLSRYINQEKAFKGQSPAGTSTQWSPEKAASDGHGFPSEVWSAICVLVHIMSGDPPWLKRYHAAAMLHFIIYQNSPPLQDVPESIRPEMMRFIKWGFTIKECERPSAEKLLNDPVFRLIGGHDVPDTCYSILSNENPPLLPSPSPKTEELEAIVQNLQRKMEIADRQALRKTVVSNTKTQEFRIRPDIIKASSLMSQIPITDSKNVNSMELPKLSILEKVNSSEKRSDLNHPKFSLLASESIPLFGVIFDKTVSSSQKINSNITDESLFGSNSSQGSVTQSSSDFNNFNTASQTNRCATALPTATSQCFSNPSGQPAIKSYANFNNVDPTVLSSATDNNYTNPNIFGNRNKNVGVDVTDNESIIHDPDNLNIMGNPVIKSSNSLNHINPQQVPILKTSKSAPGQIAPENYLMLNRFQTSESGIGSIHICNEHEMLNAEFGEKCDSTLFPPSLQSLQRKLNTDSITENPQIVDAHNLSSSRLEKTDLHGADCIYDSFLNDDIDFNAVTFATPNLNLYQQNDRQLNTKSKLDIPNISNKTINVPSIFENEEWENSSQIPNVQSAMTNATNPNNSVSLNQPIIDEMYENSSNDSSQSKHKSALHININQPLKTLYFDSDKDFLKTAPIQNGCKRQVDFKLRTADPLRNPPEWSQKSPSPRSTATRSSCLDEERDQLLKQLSPNSQYFDQDPESSDLFESAEESLDVVQEKELQTLMSKQLQSTITERNGILDFLDEENNLICSVRLAPTITNWKDLFETSPILQKIQDKNIFHFKINYQENGSRVAIDYGTPIDKLKTNLTVSPTSADDLNCWCDNHLNI